MIKFIAMIVLLSIEKVFEAIESIESFFKKKRKAKLNMPEYNNREALEKQAAKLAFVYLEEVYKRMAGEPLSFGAKVVYTEILSGESAKYGLVTTPEIFRLGVISYFALIAAMYPARDFFGVIITRDSAEDYLYEQDRYGQTKISVEEYLSAFGISVKDFSTYMQETNNQIFKKVGKALAVTSLNEFMVYVKDYKGIEMSPIIEDDGERAKLADTYNVFRKRP